VQRQGMNSHAASSFWWRWPAHDPRQGFAEQQGFVEGKLFSFSETTHIYFRVLDITAATERIKANGGRILNGPMEVPGGDWMVNAMDLQGAAFALHARRGHSAGSRCEPHGAARAMGWRSVRLRQERPDAPRGSRAWAASLRTRVDGPATGRRACRRVTNG
jgi:hypothetical protein